VKKKTRVPRQRRSLETVAAILEATERVLETEGAEAVTTERVAEVAGVGIGTLYEYFSSKKALVHAVENRSWPAIASALLSRMDGLTGAPLERVIGEIVQLALELIVERGSLHGATPDDPSRSVVFEQIADAVLARIEPEHFALLRPANPRLALVIVAKTVAALGWLGLRDHREEVESGEYAREVTQMIVLYLVKDAAP